MRSAVGYDLWQDLGRCCKVCCRDRSVSGRVEPGALDLCKEERGIVNVCLGIGRCVW